MSIKFRILGAIAALLALVLLCGGTFLLLRARSVAEIEVRTAFQGAENAVRDTLKSDVEHTVTLRQVVASFEGQRHVRAALINENGKVIAESKIGQLANPAPDRALGSCHYPRTPAGIDLGHFRCMIAG